MEATTLDLNNASEDWSECLKQLPLPSSSSQSPDVTALHVTPPLHPAPCTTRGPSVDMEATTLDLTSDMPDGEKMREEMFQELLMQDWEWERYEDRSALFLISTCLWTTSPQEHSARTMTWPGCLSR